MRRRHISLSQVSKLRLWKALWNQNPEFLAPALELLLFWFVLFKKTEMTKQTHLYVADTENYR